MKTILSNLATAIDHNRYTALAVLLIIPLLMLVGCEAFYPIRTTSPTTGQKVTAGQLQIEGDSAAAQIQIEAKALQVKADTVAKQYAEAAADIQRKRDAINSLANFAIEGLNALPVPWAGTLALAATGLATGLGLDNKRKDKVIEAKSAPTTGAV